MTTPKTRRKMAEEAAKEFALVYPRKWKNKKSKKCVRVMPWWEVVKDGEIEKVDALGNLLSEQAGIACKFGVLTQIGYLIENEHGFWFGMGPKAREAFKDMGEWKKKRK